MKRAMKQTCGAQHQPDDAVSSNTDLGPCQRPDNAVLSQTELVSLALTTSGQRP